MASLSCPNHRLVFAYVAASVAALIGVLVFAALLGLGLEVVHWAYCWLFEEGDCFSIFHDDDDNHKLLLLLFSNSSFSSSDAPSIATEGGVSGALRILFVLFLEGYIFLLTVLLALLICGGCVLFCKHWSAARQDAKLRIRKRTS
jgi:hypothetical protein